MTKKLKINKHYLLFFKVKTTERKRTFASQFYLENVHLMRTFICELNLKTDEA